MKKILSSVVVLTLALQVEAQGLPQLADAVPAAVRTGMRTAQLIQVDPSEIDQPDWRVMFNRIEVFRHGSPDSIATLKESKTAVRAQSTIGIGNDNSGARAVTPTLHTTILGNQMNNGTPPDNTVAISNGGRIIAVDNDRMDVYNENGTTAGNIYHSTFFNGFSHTGSIFDPRVIYDPVADRFIYVIVRGSHSTTSRIYIAFSKTNNPGNSASNWWIYWLSGNPNNASSWLDYPNIGISNDELFISGNLFTNNFQFDQSVVYQISTAPGYNGQTISFDVWANLNTGTSTSKAFTVVPASYGQNGGYGPGIYMVSASSNQNNRIYLFQVTNNLNNNPQLLVSTVMVPFYSVAPNAQMQGSSDQLDNGDCRMQHAFYLNGNVHCVHAADYNSTAYNGIRYYRIPVTNVSQVQSSSFGISGTDYSYPSLASFGMNECDQSVMIGFLASNSSMYPQIRVVNCDNNMTWSGSTLVVSGTNPVNMMSGSSERWGDYSSLVRKHNANTPEVWMSGCYGSTSNRWRTGIGQIKGGYEPAPVPVAAFMSNTDTAEATAFINFYDNSSGNPTSWKWSFEGGFPSTSTQQNPLVMYTDSGTFNVKLVVRNAFCPDSTEMDNYIHIYKLYRDTLIMGGVTVYVVGQDSFQIWDGKFVPLGFIENRVQNQVRVYPNPTRTYEAMTLEVSTMPGERIVARVLDVHGREVRLLFDDYPKPGRHQLSFNRNALSAGTYVLEVRNNGNIVHHESIVVLP